MADTDKHPCSRCNGRGKLTETRTEMDVPMSVCLGTALGTGLFPSYKTAEEERSCPVCLGTGKSRW